MGIGDPAKITGERMKPKLDRIPPQDLEAEMCTLGSMMVSPTGVDTVVSLLVKSDFYRDTNADIYDAMLALYEADIPVDMMTLKDELLRRNKLDAIGGMDFLAQLLDIVPSAANAEHYASIVLEKANLRRLRAYSETLAKRIDAGADEFPAIMQTAEDDLFQLVDRKASLNDPPLPKLLDQARDDYDARYAGRGQRGVQTGFPMVDMITRGMKPGHLWVVGGATGMGKTSFGLQLAINAAQTGAHTLFFSLEMRREEITERLLCNHALIDSARYDTAQLDEHELIRRQRADEALSKMPITIRSGKTATPAAIRAACRRVARKEPVKIILIDYIQRIHSGKHAENRNLELGEVIRMLQELSEEMNACVIVLSQVGRDASRRENKRPTKNDLRDSGTLEQEANVVLLLYRKSYYSEEPPSPENWDDCELIIDKCRGGNRGIAHVGFLPYCTRFQDYGRSQ